MGRVKDYHLLPFSFREYLLYNLRTHPALSAEADRFHGLGRVLQDILAGAPGERTSSVSLTLPTEALRNAMDTSLQRYFLEGGFPEVWELKSALAKQEYLYDNQVKKVIYEDLVLAAEFRKPELLKRFYISLLETPGREATVPKVSEESTVGGRQIERYLPYLEMTDLVHRIEKFRKSPIRVRRGRMKFYLVDLALRNAVLRLTEGLLEDDQILGLYAENLVFLALRKWPGKIQLDYYREPHGDVDFIAHVGTHRYLPVEVKYRRHLDPEDFAGCREFVRRYPRSWMPLVVSRRWGDFGERERCFLVPLPMFLLLFD